MAVHSGQLAAINGVSTVRNWSVGITGDNKKFIASNTLRGSGRRRGIKSWSGSYGAYGGLPAQLPGAIAAFVGYLAPANDVSGSGKTSTGNIICDQSVITWNWGSGDIVSYVNTFSGVLAHAWGTGTVTDATAPDVPGICGLHIDYSADGETWTPYPALVQAVLTLTAANVSFVNSDTNCWTGKKAGPLDWTLALTSQHDAFPIAVGDDVQLRCYIDAVRYWELKWGKLKDHSGITADRETGAMIQHTANFEMQGFEDVAESPTVGHILLPDNTEEGDNTEWWPGS